MRIQKIEDFMERYVGGGAADKLDRLDRLQTNMTDTLSHMEGDWDKARSSFNLSQSGMEGAFDVTAKTVGNSRTRVNKILRKMEEFRADEIAWEQHGIAMALKTKEQSLEDHLDPKKVLPVHRDISEAHKIKVIKAHGFVESLANTESPHLAASWIATRLAARSSKG
jgi:hypothetical protein